MDRKLRQQIDAMAQEILGQAEGTRVDTFLSYVHTSDIINRYLDLQLPDKRISRAGFNVLHVLILNSGGLIPTDISKKTFRSKFSVTRVVDTLEKHGLVARRGAGRDRRTRRVEITAGGLKAVEDATIDLRERLSRDIFGVLEDDRLLDFNGALWSIRHNVLALIDDIGERRKDDETDRAD